MYLRFVCIILLVVSSPVRASSGAAVEAFAEGALVGMQLSIKRALQQGKVLTAEANCMQSFRSTSFGDVFTKLLAEELSEGELRQADAFYSSPPGRNHGELGLLQIYAAVGEPLPRPLPTFSDGERHAIESYSKSGGGEKLFGLKVLEGPRAKQAVGARIQTLWSTCRGTR